MEDLSQLTIGNNNYALKDGEARSSINEIVTAIQLNNSSISTHINDLNTRVDELESYEKKYLTFVALESGVFQFTNPINYSIDNGTTWVSLAANTDTPTITAGSKIIWKAELTPTSPNGIGSFSSTGNFNVEGNIMSLLFGDNFIGQTDLSGKDRAFNSLFRNTKVINAENLSLSAITLTDNCYNSMFRDCINLTSAPKLPTIVLSQFCYAGMFFGCTNLTSAPELPATTLQQYCYSNMFQGCTSLTSAPELPATTLADGCYQSMFSGCTSLTTAPELPATILVNYCYQSMFNDCTNLNFIKCLAINISASGCTYGWVSNVAENGIFVKNNNAEWNVTVDDGVPEVWEVYTEDEYKVVRHYEISNELTGKQDLINNSNKLSADLITDGAVNKVINVKPDWNAASGNAAEILNKPTIPSYNTFGASGANHSSGLVPDPGAAQGTTKYLREDGTWAVPESGANLTDYVQKSEIYEEISGGYVDLGLPSGLLWATGNIVKDDNGDYSMGDETDYGCCFSWGNVDGHNANEGYDFSDESYPNTAGSQVSADIASNDSAHDAAFACLGSPYHLPTKDDLQELKDNTDCEWTTIDGINGWKFMKKTDHSVYVFLPAAGCDRNTSVSDVNTRGYYWSSSWYSADSAYDIGFHSSTVYPQSRNIRYYGFSVRAVTNTPPSAPKYTQKSELADVATSGSYNDLVDKPTIPNLSLEISKSAIIEINETLGGTDNNAFLSSISVNNHTITANLKNISELPIIASKEDKMVVVTQSSGTTLTAAVGNYYRFTYNVGTLDITLPTPTGSNAQSVLFFMTTGASPAVAFTSTGNSIYKSDGFVIDASTTYEINALWNGGAWVINAVKYDISVAGVIGVIEG